MKSLDEFDFYTERGGKSRGGKVVGRCAEFPDLRTRPRKRVLDAVSEIVDLASERLREIDESRWRATL